MRTVLIGAAGLLLLAFSGRPADGATPLHFWSQGHGDAGSDIGASVAADALGNVFLTGTFNGSVDFGGGVLVSAGMKDIFLSKYTPAGTHLWSKQFGSTGDDSGVSVATDPSGNVFLTGAFRNTVDFGGGNLVSAGDQDVFLAKFDPAGTHLWSQRFGNTSVDVGVEVATDASGRAFLTGAFAGAVDFGGGALANAGFIDIFIAAYDPAGVHLWSKRFGNIDGDGGTSVATNSSGNVLVTGFFRGSVDFGGGALVSAGGADIFLAEYTSAGTHLWSKRFGSVGDDSVGRMVATDASTNVFVTGSFAGSVDFGGGALASAGGQDIFVAEFNPSGTHLWSKRFGSASNDDGFSVATDPAGNAFVTGSFAGSVDFGGGTLVSAGGTDAFVAQYSPTGAHLWSKRFGDVGDDAGSWVAVDPAGDVLLTGNFQGSVDFGGGALASAGSDDVYLTKYHAFIAVPVLITRFEATARPGGVDLAWEFSSDEAVADFQLYRRSGDVSAVVATGDAQTVRSYTDASVVPGATYEYELVIRTAGGDEFRSPAATATIPAAVTTLAQNFPNPFNPATTIVFTLKDQAHVRLAIYDVAGRHVRTLVDDVRTPAVAHRFEWDGRNDSGVSVSSGVYFYKLATAGYTETKKMVLMK